MSFWDPYTLVLALSLVVSFSVFYRIRPEDTYLKIFPPYLLATLLVELLGYYLASSGQQNVWVYNFFSTFEFCVYVWIISLIISSKSIKKIMRVLMVIYALVAVNNILFVQGMKAFHTMTYALGCLVVVACCIYYFFELFKLPTSVKLTSTPAFWICSGLLFFYVCGFTMHSMLLSYWSDISKLLQRNFVQILTILNIFLYSLFTIAFLCIRTRKYTLSPS